jgi:excisionase family DNA binding protein
MTSGGGEAWLTTREAADCLGFKDTARVRHLIAAGRLRAIKRGRDLFVRADDVALFTRRKRGPKSRARPPGRA